jgi:uncharacterized protein YoxC
MDAELYITRKAIKDLEAQLTEMREKTSGLVDRIEALEEGVGGKAEDIQYRLRCIEQRVEFL